MIEQPKKSEGLWRIEALKWSPLLQTNEICTLHEGIDEENSWQSWYGRE